MKLTLDTGTHHNLISSFEMADEQGNGAHVMVKGQRIEQNCIITPTQILDWTPGALADMTDADLQKTFDTQAPIVLLGTGETCQTRTDFMITAIRHSVGLEIMDTPAACRTFNVLLSEDRDVVVALILNPHK